MKNKGFTLIEVIVVAIIVLVLAAVAIPIFQGYKQLDDTITIVNGKIQSTSKEEVIDNTAKFLHDIKSTKKQLKQKLDSLDAIENLVAPTVIETVFVKDDWAR